MAIQTFCKSLNFSYGAISQEFQKLNFIKYSIFYIKCNTLLNNLDFCKISHGK